MRKKTFILLCILSLYTFLVSAQQIDYNKIILPDGTTNISLEERLVQLAWKNNPASSMARRDVAIAQYDVKVIRTDWLSQIGANGNLNEYTIKALDNNNTGTQTQIANYYPRYNVYIHVPLSSIFQRPIQRKSAQEQVLYTQDKLNLLKLEIRARVLKLYAEFRKNEIIYNIRKDALADEESNYLLIEEKFKNGNITLEEYMRGQKSRNDQKIQTATAENLYIQAKLELEEVIGVKYEEVVR